ncbi:hypothetical protein ACFL5O_10320 [Myxococcota bacterium]
MSRFRFDADDLRFDLPVPGWYSARVQQARFRRSPSHNRMLEVVYAVAEVDPPYAHGSGSTSCWRAVAPWV